MLTAALASTALLAAACGDDDDSSDTTPAAATATQSTSAASPTGAPTEAAPEGIDYARLSGSVRVDGSSTVFPISEAVAEEFSKVARSVQANVAFSGTGGGFEKFCRGEIEVSDASRPINQKELDACAGNDIPADDIVEIQVAIDALTLVVSPQNTWATCVTPAQVQQLFKRDGASRWSDIDPAWPDDTISFLYPGADSGTFDYFKEAIKLRGEANNEPAHRSDGTASEDDNVLVRGIEGDRNAIGYFGLAYYEAAGDRLAAVEIDNGNGCVAPSFETALSGDYAPLSRPIYIYTRASLLEDRPEVLGFVNFYVENMNELSKEVGYVSLPDSLLAEQRAKVEPYIR